MFFGQQQSDELASDPPRKGGYSGRFDILSRETADDDDGEWIVQDNKRRRRSTGGTFNSKSLKELNIGQAITKAEFKAMSTDDKLVTLFELMSSLGTIDARMTTVENNVHNINKHVSSHTNRLKLLEYKSIDSEARNRRNNLIFRGISETNENEDCETIIHGFLRDRLGLDFIPVIQRAHRLGNPRGRRRFMRGSIRGQSQPPRPIIACFRDYGDIEVILGNATKLKDTQFGINKDFPKEIIEARSKLWPFYKAERAKNPGASVYIGFPAKLVVRGSVIKDEFPDWYNVLRGSKCNTDSEVINTSPAPEPNTHQSSAQLPSFNTSHTSETDDDMRDMEIEIEHPDTEPDEPAKQVNGASPTNTTLAVTCDKNSPSSISSASANNQTSQHSEYDEAMVRLSGHLSKIGKAQSKKPTVDTRTRASSVPARSRKKQAVISEGNDPPITRNAKAKD